MLRTLRISNLVLIREAELELGQGLNAITGETGAGKTILTNAVGLLLGKGDVALIGCGDEAYARPSRRVGDDFGARRIATEGEDDVVLPGFSPTADPGVRLGSAAREDVAAAAEALIAMSGQLEQRRLCGRPTSATCRRVRGARHGGGGPRLRARERRGGCTTS